MSKRVQRLGHTTGQANLFIGLSREITVVTDTGELRVHDGLTPGGIPILTTVQNDLRYQPLDADLTAIAVFDANPGILAKTGAGAWARRTLVAGSSAIVITNGDGQAGNPSINASADLQQLSSFASGVGIPARTAANTWALRTLTAPAAGIQITNADGVGGNPTLVLANDLNSLENLTTFGFATRKGTSNWDTRVFAVGAGLSVSNSDGVGGDVTYAIATDVLLPGTGGARVPFGTTAQRPGSPTNGIIRYNTETSRFECYDNGWESIATDVTVAAAYQPLDSDLTAVAALSGTGYIARTGAGTMAARQLTADSGVGITNPQGVAGDSTFSLNTPHFQCRLDYSNTTTIKLNRFQGSGLIWINGKHEVIPVGGVSLTAPATNGVTYYIYAFMNTGTMTLEAVATVPVADVTHGHMVKTGDTTRTLVGMARTVSSQWVDTLQQRFVISWFNRKRLSLHATGATSGTTNTSPTEGPANWKVEFLHWANETLDFDVIGFASNNTGGQWVTTQASLDGVTSGAQYLHHSSSANFGGAIGGNVTGPNNTDGYHYVSIFHWVSAGTASTVAYTKGIIFG